MPNIATGFAVNSSIHPYANASEGGGTETSSPKDLLEEDGITTFLLENGSGVILLN